MIFLSRENELILSGSQSLYFYASWMPYHKRMISMIGKMEQKYKDLGFFAIDTDYFKTFCKRFDITSIPTIIIFKDGKELKRIEGLILTSALKVAFADICDSIGEPK
jgi:thiol-disulfide isomerase/thioredoxin